MDAAFERRILVGLLLVGLAIRLGWGLVQRGGVDERLGDQFEYLELGRNWLKTGELGFFDSRFGQKVFAYRTPGYPAFVAACGGNVVAIRVVQGVIDAFTALAIYLIGKRWVGGRGALVAGALVAFNPFLIYFSALVLSETVFTALLAWGMYWLVRQEKGGLSVVVGQGILCLAVLVRPSAMGVVVGLSVGAAVVCSRSWIAEGLVACGILSVTLLPWAYRNSRHPAVASWVWTTTNNGITTYDGFHASANGASDQKKFLDPLMPLLVRMDEVERDAYLSQQAHQWIQEHPRRTVELAAIKVGRTWSPVPLSAEYGSSRLYVVIGLIFSLPLDVMILLGLWRGTLVRSAKVFLSLPAIYFTVIHALSVGSLRYRVPCEPPMAVIVGACAVFGAGCSKSNDAP